MKQQINTQIVIPDDLEFTDLRLTRDPSGSVTFDMGAIERICEASHLEIEIFIDAPEDNVSGLIVSWYLAHKKRGGKPDTVAEDLIAEVLAENQAGQTISYPPGRA